MVNLNKNITRSILIASYILIIVIIISGISSLFAYLNTGADRSSMLHTKLKKIEQKVEILSKKGTLENFHTDE